MIDQSKKVELTHQIRRMNLAEEQELKTLGFSLNKDGDLVTNQSEKKTSLFEKFRRISRKKDWSVSTRAKIVEHILEQLNMSRRNFLKLTTQGTATLALGDMLGTDISKLFTHQPHPEIPFAERTLRLERERNLIFSFAEPARLLLLRFAQDENKIEMIQETMHVADLSQLSLDDLLSTLESFYQQHDLETNATQEISDSLRLHYMTVKAVINLFENETISNIRHQYNIQTLGEFISWYGTIFCAGEFYNLMHEIVVDYQSERGRCIDGSRFDAIIWVNQLPQMFFRYFTSLFREELGGNIEQDAESRLESEDDRLGLLNTSLDQLNPEKLKAAFQGLIRALAYSDKFNSNANHTTAGTAIGLEDTVGILDTLNQEQFLGGWTLDRLHDILLMTFEDEIPDIALSPSPDRILGVYAYTAAKNSDGSINTNDFGGQAVNFWLRYARAQQGQWLVLPEGILLVTVTETANEMTIAIGGENNQSIKNIDNALRAGGTFSPSLREDGLTQESSVNRLSRINEIHLGRRMAQAYTETYRNQRNLQREINLGVQYGTLEEDVHKEKFQQLNKDRLQLRFAEISRSLFESTLETLSSITTSDETFQQIKSALLTARPSLEQEKPHLNMQIFFIMLLKIYDFHHFLPESSELSSDQLQQGLRRMLDQEAMAPYDANQYFEELFDSGLATTNPGDYGPFSVTRATSVSESHFPLTSFNMQVALFRNSAMRSAEQGIPGMIFCATDRFGIIGEIEDHFQQIVQYTRWAIRFNTQESRIEFYTNKGNGLFGHYQLDDSGVHILEDVTLTAESYRQALTDETYFVGRPPKINR